MNRSRVVMVVALAACVFAAEASYGALEVRPSAALAPPVLSVEPTDLSGDVTVGASTTLTLAVRNAGGKAFAWSVSSVPEWMRLDPTVGEVVFEGAEQLTVTVDAAALTEGELQGQIVIEAEGVQGSPVSVPVTIRVTPLDVPSPLESAPGETDLYWAQGQPRATRTPPKGFGIRGGAIVPSTGDVEPYETGTTIGAFWRPRRDGARFGYELGLNVGRAQSVSGNSESTILSGAADWVWPLAGGIDSGYSVYAITGMGVVHESATHEVLGDKSGTATVIDLGFGATFAADRLDVRASYSVLAGSGNVGGLAGVSFGVMF